VSADGGGIKFNSAMAGTISVPWAKIKTLDSSKTFAVIVKNAKLTKKDAVADVPQGTVATTDKTITVAAPAGPKAVQVADTNLVMPSADFLKTVNKKPSLLQGWGGTATGGVALVRSTQNTTTYTTGISLARPEPGVAWLPAKSNTTLDFSQSYGTTTQAGQPTIETNIFHADAERDEYFSPKLFVDGNVAFDHNFSSALALQQAYGFGIGMVVIKNAKQELDVRGDVHYEKQQFFVPASNLNLVASTFSETYIRHLKKGIVVNEFGSASPAWNDSSAFAAHVNGSVVFPVWKGLGFNVTVIDDYLNNAPLGTKQNSSQFTTGITYTIKPR